MADLNPSPRPISAPTSPPAILIVDDDPVLRASLAALLGCHGYETVEAADGRQGLELLQQGSHHFAAALIDQSMPLMSGLELYDLIRRHNPHLPVILLSGYSVADLLATHATASDHYFACLEKPTSLQLLTDTVRRLTTPRVDPH